MAYPWLGDDEDDDFFEGNFYLGMTERWTIKANPSRSVHILKNKDQTQVNGRLSMISYHFSFQICLSLITPCLPLCSQSGLITNHSAYPLLFFHLCVSSCCLFWIWNAFCLIPTCQNEIHSSLTQISTVSPNLTWFPPTKINFYLPPIVFCTLLLYLPYSIYIIASHVTLDIFF